MEIWISYIHLASREKHCFKGQFLSSKLCFCFCPAWENVLSFYEALFVITMDPNVLHMFDELLISERYSPKQVFPSGASRYPLTQEHV